MDVGLVGLDALQSNVQIFRLWILSINDKQLVQIFYFLCQNDMEICVWVFFGPNWIKMSKIGCQYGKCIDIGTWSW